MGFKTPEQSQIMIRKVVAPAMLSPNKTLFGGYIMSWIDEVAFMSARRYSGQSTVVTANIDNISFLYPIKEGEQVVLTARVNYVGRSSMEIGVRVEIENAFSGKLTHTNSAYLTFVALDSRAKPVSVPKLMLETEEDQRRYEEAKLRVKIRMRLRRHLKSKLKISNTTRKLLQKPPSAFINPVTVYKEYVYKISHRLKDQLEKLNRGLF